MFWPIPLAIFHRPDFSQRLLYSLSRLFCKLSWCLCSKVQYWGMDVEGTRFIMGPSTRAAGLRQNYFTLMRSPKSVVRWQHRAAQGLAKGMAKEYVWHKPKQRVQLGRKRQGPNKNQIENETPPSPNTPQFNYRIIQQDPQPWEERNKIKYNWTLAQVMLSRTRSSAEQSPVLNYKNPPCPTSF